MVLTGLLAASSAFAGTLLAVPLCAWVAKATGFVDHPGPLKVQTSAVPYLGGAAVFAGMLAAAWTRVRAEGLPAGVLWPLGIAFVLGAADDGMNLPIAARVLGEIAVGATLAWALPTRLGSGAWVPVVLIVLLLVNGTNLLDGLDGLAAGVVGASALGFALTLGGTGRIAALTCLGAVCGFLVVNRPPARMYLGDGGSYLLGTALAVLVLLAWSRAVPVATSVGSLLFLALPVAEICWAVVRRRRGRRPLLSGDRGHSYDKLSARGWRTGLVTLAAAGLQLLLVGAGIAAGHLGVPGAVVLVVLVAGALLVGAAAAGFLRPADDSAG